MLTLQPYLVKVWGRSTDRPLHQIMVHTYSEDEAKEDALRSFRAALALSGKDEYVTKVEVESGGSLGSKHASQKSLFERLADVCAQNENMTDIQGAALNLLLTCLHKRYDNLVDAAARWDELMGRGKVALERRFRREQDAAEETDIAQRIGA